MLLKLTCAGFLLCATSRAQRLAEIIAKARAKGLSGYDLLDACDIWFGDDTPPYHAPKDLLDKLGNRDGSVTTLDWGSAGLPASHFQYFDKDGNGVLDVHEVNSWWLQRQPARTMNLSEVDDPPKGHMERLGSWRKPLPVDGLIYHKPYPHPREFWQKHMDGYLPALLKGAQHGWPCMNWTREVLNERFGWVDVKLEPKKEGRGNDTAYQELDSIAPRHRLNMSEYLRIEEGKNMYVVSILPQAMAWEAAHPSVLLCGSRRKMLDRRRGPPYKMTKHEYPHENGHTWMTHVFEANLWMGSGITRSQLHTDKEWNVNCLLSGRKRWFFMDPFEYAHDWQWARGKKFVRKDPLNNKWTDWVYLDPDHTDLIVQHKLRDMDYYELIQEPGDCVFIPYYMLHQVEKLTDDMQSAVSWMFLPETVYDEEACSSAPLDDDLPLAVMDTLYAYSGKGIIPQGYMDPLNFVMDLRGRMKRRKESHLSLKTFTAAVSQGEAILASIKGRNKKIKHIYDMLASYAEDPAKGLAFDELAKVPLRLLCKPAAEGDSEGPLPCDRGEEYILVGEEEAKRTEAFLREQLARRQASPVIGHNRKGKRLNPKNQRVYPERRHERAAHPGSRADEL